MTELQIAIAIGQASAEQIEAHQVAGELPIVMFEPRFKHTYCSQCGRDCGPGDEGFSSCTDHSEKYDMKSLQQELRKPAHYLSMRKREQAADYIDKLQAELNAAIKETS